MKRSLLLVLLFAVISGGCTKDETILPTIRVTRLNSGSTHSLNAICFNGNKGFIAGSMGAVFRYEGGDLWSIVTINSSGVNFNSISLPTTEVGYISGSGKLFKTIDGGDTWTLKNASYDFKDAVFPTENIGYMISGEDVYKTTNGGQSWSSTSFPFTAFQPSVIAASGPDSIFVTDFEGDVYITRNGGTSWSEGARPGRTGNIYFRDNLTGIATSDQIYKTTNGGNSWQTVTDLDEFGIGGIHMPDAKMGYAVGNGCIFVSRDGGSSWQNHFTQDGTSIEATLLDVYFINSTTGFAVSEEGNIYKLEDEK